MKRKSMKVGEKRYGVEKLIHICISRREKQDGQKLKDNEGVREGRK